MAHLPRGPPPGQVAPEFSWAERSLHKKFLNRIIHVKWFALNIYVGEVRTKTHIHLKCNVTVAHKIINKSNLSGNGAS